MLYSQIIDIDILYIVHVQNHRLQACLDPMLTPLLSNDCYNFVYVAPTTKSTVQE